MVPVLRPFPGDLRARLSKKMLNGMLAVITVSVRVDFSFRRKVRALGRIPRKDSLFHLAEPVHSFAPGGGKNSLVPGPCGSA
jgi:hypothetical protein